MESSADFTASAVPIGFFCSQIWFIPENFSISFVTESFSKPTTKEVSSVKFETVSKIRLSIDSPPTGWRDFALFDSILEPSPAARITVWIFTI